jgi:(2Fe-2S) ferredoxin
MRLYVSLDAPEKTPPKEQQIRSGRIDENKGARVMKKSITPYACHIFICTNVRENNPAKPGCGTCGTESMKTQIKEMIAARGWKGRVRVSTTGCMGLCSQGPNILIHPQGIHYSEVTEADLPVILDAINL